MKRVQTFLSNQEYKAFTKKAEELELSEYFLLKQAILLYLFSDVSNGSDDAARPYVQKVKALKHQKKWAYATISVLLCYFVFSLAYILFFIR